MMSRDLERGARPSGGATTAQGGLLRLNRGEPYYATPSFVADGVMEALREGRTHYSPKAGIPELRERIAARLTVESYRAITRDEVLVTNGAAGAVHAAIRACVRPGDEVILFDPEYSIYASTIDLAGGIVVRIPLDPPEFTADMEALARRITERTRLVIYSSPQNPTGNIIDRQNLQRLAHLSGEHGFFVLADEVYSQFSYDGWMPSALSVPAFDGRLFYVNSFSKEFAMTGWRVGYLVAPEEFRSKATKIHAQSCISAGTPAQWGAVAALERGGSWVQEVREEYRRSRDVLFEGVQGLSGVTAVCPPGGLYLLPRCGSETSESATELLRSSGLLVRDATEFGVQTEGHVRVSFCVPEEQIVQALEVLERANRVWELKNQ